MKLESCANACVNLYILTYTQLQKKSEKESFFKQIDAP